MDNMSLCHVCSSRYAARRWGAAGAVAAVLLYYRTTIVCGVAPVAAVLLLYYTIVCGVAPHTTPISLSDWSVLVYYGEGLYKKSLLIGLYYA